MGQQLRRRFQQTVEYSSNQKSNEQLSRGMIYREIHLRLRGAATVTTGNNTAAKTGRGAEWACVKRIDLVANNTDTIKSISGNALWWMNYFMYHTAPPVQPLYGDAATANVAFDSCLILPLWMPNSVRPFDTCLDARNFSDLKIEVTWGTFTDISTDASAWTTEPYIDVHSMESFGAAGSFAQWRVYEIEKEIVASSARFQIQLPVGNMYRGFLINTTDAGVDQGDIMNNFKWKSGTNVFADIPGRVLQQVSNLRSGNQRELGGLASDAYLGMQRSASSSIDGWYWYDHVTDGMLSEAIDTIGFSQTELELDVTVGGGETKIFVYPMEIVPVRKEQNAGQRLAA